MRNSVAHLFSSTIPEIFSRTFLKIAVSVANKLDVVVTSKSRLESEKALVADLLLRQGQLKSSYNEIARRHEKANELASTSPVTGLPNLRVLEVELKREYRRAIRSKESFLLFLIDADKFKDINDTYDHPSGDSAIRYIGRAIKNALRDSDILIHKSGDEFFVLAPLIIPSDITGAERDAKIEATSLYLMDRVRLAVAAGEFMYSRTHINTQLRHTLLSDLHLASTLGLSRQSILDTPDLVLRIGEDECSKYVTTHGKVTISCGGVIFAGHHYKNLKPTDEDIRGGWEDLIARTDQLLKKSKSSARGKGPGNFASLGWSHISDPQEVVFAIKRVTNLAITNTLQEPSFELGLPLSPGKTIRSDTFNQTFPNAPQSEWQRPAFLSYHAPSSSKKEFSVPTP